MHGRIFYSLSLAAFVLAGCRGWTTDQAPIHPNPNMDTQPKYKAYRESEWFKDKRAMRPISNGVVARGQLDEDEHFFQGKVNGQLATSFPERIQVDHAFLERGRERFNISCTPCHQQTGEGTGMVARRLTIKPPTFHTDYMHNMPLGHFFNVMANGIRTMPDYSHIPEHDRWAIVAYIRALQLSQDADSGWLSARR